MCVFGLLSWVAYAACNPLTMDKAPTGTRLWNARPLLQDHSVPGTSLTLRGSADGVWINADDGGGAGQVDLPRKARNADARSRVSIEARGASAFVVKVQPDPNSDTVYFTRFDRDGVRLDDSFADRFHHRRVMVAFLLFCAWFGLRPCFKRGRPEAVPTTPSQDA